VEAYGDVDELNSSLGNLTAAVPEEWTDITGQLRVIQSELFHIGAWLATTPAAQSEALLEEFTAERVLFLENAIDRMEEQLLPLGEFILPGGHRSAAAAHVSRAVCRRAERRVVELLERLEPKPPPVSWQQLLRYLNRLSDYLFVLARFCNHRTGVAEPLWKS
jgi:cob(I)alamin adenosyltransferase